MKYLLFEIIIGLKVGEPTKNIIIQERNPKKVDQSFIVKSSD